MDISDFVTYQRSICCWFLVPNMSEKFSLVFCSFLFLYEEILKNIETKVSVKISSGILKI